jgi:two-component system cell cycle response regulator DivK
MLHIAYIESDRHRQFTFEQIAILLRANSFDNQLLFYQDIATAIERLPVERPDIVFVGVRACTERKPSGLDLVQALRQHPLCKRIVIIGMAEYAMPADRNAALDAGCNGFIPEPVRYQAVEDAIQQYFGRISSPSHSTS